MRRRSMDTWRRIRDPDRWTDPEQDKQSHQRKPEPACMLRLFPSPVSCMLEHTSKSNHLFF